MLTLLSTYLPQGMTLTKPDSFAFDPKAVVAVAVDRQKFTITLYFSGSNVVLQFTTAAQLVELANKITASVP